MFPLEKAECLGLSSWRIKDPCTARKGSVPTITKWKLLLQSCSNLGETWKPFFLSHKTFDVMKFCHFQNTTRSFTVTSRFYVEHFIPELPDIFAADGQAGSWFVCPWTAVGWWGKHQSMARLLWVSDLLSSSGPPSPSPSQQRPLV